MTPRVFLEFASAFSAIAAAAFWLKSTALGESRLRVTTGRVNSGRILLVGENTDPVELGDVESQLNGLSEALRHQCRWTAVGARFAALAIFLQVITIFMSS